MFTSTDSDNVQTSVVLTLLILFCATANVYSAHFRGGVIMVRPKSGGAAREMEISYQISWRRSISKHECNSIHVANGVLFGGESNIKCQYSCSGTIISPISYVCTYFSIEDDWSFGENHQTHTFNSANTITIGTASGNWIKEAGDGKWNISTTFSLVTRADTGKINSSPRVLPTPPLRLQQRCSYTIPLPVSDPDNDTVRCRWAVGRECSSICNKLPGAILDSSSCTITYTANHGTGIKAVAIMIEDYAPGSPHRPLSSVALQFLVMVFSSCSTQTECLRFPAIILHPSSKTVFLTQIKSTNIILTCMANETSSYYWERQNGNIPFTSIGVRTNTLTLINVKPEDAGRYRCVAFVCNIVSRSFSNYARVTVNVLRPVLVSHPSSQYTSLTQTATFTCNATGYNVSYQWTIGSGSFPSKVTGIYRNTLMIPDVRSSDDNTYTCIASNQRGSVSSKAANLTVIDTDISKVTVTPINQRVEVTLSAKFIATVKGVGPFAYQWRRGKHNISNEVHSSFIINEVSVKDTGYYRCYATNNYGNSVLSSRAFLQVIINLPVIIKNPTSTPLSLTSNFTNVSFICEADGASSYYWQRQDGSISASATGVNTSSLTIISLQLKDAGYYRCIATNGSGSTKSKYAKLTLTVARSTVVTQPTDTSAAAPFSGVFTCSVSGYGYQNITWYKQSGTLPHKYMTNEMTSGGVTTSTLIIPNVTKEDVGKYYCQVWANNVGIRSEKADLYYSGTPIKPTVAGPPGRLIKLRVNNHMLRMKCLPYDRSFSYKWERKNKQLPSTALNINSERLRITNLKPDDSGEYRCIMSNSTGQIASDYSLVTVKVALPKIIQQPSSTVTEVYDAATFECMARSYGIVSISWQRLNSEVPVTANITVTKSLNEIKSVLRIEKSIGYYKGYYYCVIENKAGIVNSTFVYCNVTVPCPQMIIAPQPVVVRPSATITFSCLAWSYGGLLYKWNRNGISNLPHNATVFFQDKSLPADTNCFTTVYELKIVNVHVRDEGLYCCIASNECGNDKGCAWLEVDTSPIIAVQPKSQAFNDKGKNVLALWIVATGVGPIHYQWQKYDPLTNSWIPPSSRAENVTSPNLTFSVIVEEDQGLYYCIASNDDGNVLSHHANITVYGSPNITYYTNGIVVFEGKKVTLICNATNDGDAIDPVQISWYNGTKLLKSDGNHITIYNKHDITTDQIHSLLILDSVSNTDDGEYICRAFNNPLCYTENKINLTVEYAPRITINPLQSPHVVTVGDRLLLYCIAKGFPIPTIQWYENSTPIPQQSSPLYLASTDTQGTTIYTCEGKNKAGNIQNTARANITVVVKKIKTCEKLNNPDNGNVFMISPQVAIFTCNSGFTTVGNSYLECKDGKWSSPPPKCQPS